MLALLGLGALGLAGCEESSGESTPELGEAESATLNGTALPEDTYEWLVRRTNGESCGGALVASNVVLTAAHCVTLGSGVEPANTSSDPLALAIEALGEDGSTVITFPIYELLEAGGDLALIVYPVDRAVPRSLLVPARVGASGEAPSATTKVASAVAHSFIPGCGCAVTGPASTITNGSVSPGVDGNGIATFEFDVSGSGRICKGDSGSPVLSNGRIVSLVATSVAVDAGCGPGTAPSDAFWGPALTNPSQRTWLLTNGLDRDGDGIEAWQDMCDTFPHRPVGSPQVDRDGRGRTVVSANLPTTGRYSLYALEGEGASFVSRRVVHANGTLVSAPWSNETAYALPVRTGTLATGTVSLKSQPLPTGSIANVWECF